MSRATLSRSHPIGRTERATLRLSVRILEKRAAQSDRVVISAAFAWVLARYLKSLLNKGD